MIYRRAETKFTAYNSINQPIPVSRPPVAVSYRMHAKPAAIALLVATGGMLASDPARAQPVAVTKGNPQKVYMHYMPWFDAPASPGGSWGYHWRMSNKNPNVVDANGRRQIASHYYPKIGPYESSDPHVVEYHLLLMKYAGVDGVMLDWYGVQGTNGDIGSLLENSNALVGKVDDFGLKFGVVLEDRFSKVSNSNQSPDINKAIANVTYLKDNYFNKPEYIRLGAGDDPLMAVFGPITFQQSSQWTQILAAAGEDVNLLTLWYEKNDAGSNADGEYAWIYENEAQDNHLTNHQTNFANLRAPTLGIAGGVAYPGFDDFYQEGGTSTVIGFDIPHDDGQTLADLLEFNSQHADDFDFLQLATFNDFGEGTMLEPTVETGFGYLEQIQNYTEVPYGKDELELVFKLYRLRKSNVGNAAVQTQLDQASADLAALEVSNARAILDALAVPGDFNGDGQADGGDFLVWQRQAGATGLYPLNTLAADGNVDGVVNELDLAIWKAASGGAAPAGAQVPEPSGAALVISAGALSAMAARRR